MGSATRSILQGLEIGERLGKPLANAYENYANRDFAKQQQDDRFKQQMNEFILNNPDLAQAFSSQEGMTAPDGQESLKGIPIDQKTLQPIVQKMGGQLVDPKVLQQASLAREERKLQNQFELQKQLSELQANQPHYDANLGVTVKPGSGTYQNLTLEGGAAPLEGALDRKAKAEAAMRDAEAKIKADDSLTKFDREKQLHDLDLKGKKELQASGFENEKTLAQLKAEGKGAKPPTESQASYQLYGKRMEQANNDLKKLNFTPVEGASYLPNRLKSEERQKFEQSQNNFINAALRKESGAAISASEHENARNQYFPQPGDSKAVLDQKSKNRALAISEFKRLGGAPEETASGGSKSEENPTYKKDALDNLYK